jgi:hypothetical protein
VSTPKIIAITVVKRHAPTKTEPIKIGFPPVLMIRNIINTINKTNISKRKCRNAKILGTGLLGLSLEITISRNAPLGHKFQHQNLPIKKDNPKKKAIIPTTK